MADVTKVCNYTGHGGFTNGGPGAHYVTLSERVHHFFIKVSSSNPQSCGLSYFIFDNSVVGGPQEKMSFFQITSGPILSIPSHSKVCQYDSCKVLLKKMTPSLPTTPPKSMLSLQ